MDVRRFMMADEEEIENNDNKTMHPLCDIPLLWYGMALCCLAVAGFAFAAVEMKKPEAACIPQLKFFVIISGIILVLVSIMLAIIAQEMSDGQECGCKVPALLLVLFLNLLIGSPMIEYLLQSNTQKCDGQFLTLMATICGVLNISIPLIAGCMVAYEYYRRK
jgi:hypothetical protein